MFDVIIIGKGPAGISAAIYLKRAGINVAVIGKGAGALEKSDKIENYYGFEEPISGAKLLEKGINQAKRLEVEILTEEVLFISKEDVFTVKTKENSYSAKAVLLATGKNRINIPIKGFNEYKGKGISFCAVCDGFFYRNKKLAVIGSGEFAASELHELFMFTKDITLFTNNLPLTTESIPKDLKVVTDKITEIVGTDLVTGIVTEKETHPIDGIFVAIGVASASDFAAKLGVFLNGNDIIVDQNFMTNVDGLFAAGDCIGGFLQVSKAVSDGAVASKAITEYIRKNKI